MLFDEKLIELVEKNDILYNKNNKCYLSISLKRKVWEKIAKQMKTPQEDVIKRYRELRDRYVRSKRVELITGGKQPVAPIVQRMNFLEPHIFNKQSDTKVTWNGDVPVTTPALQRSQEASKPQMFEETSSNSLFDTSCSSSKTNGYGNKNAGSNIKKESTDWNGEEEDHTLSDDESEYDYLNNSESDDDDDGTFYQAVHTFKDLCKTQEQSSGNSAAIDGFLHMIMSIIENMSPKKRTKAMLKVIEVLMQIKQEDD
ncbi:uncharacterized protein [Musca autumnalis]|uniref:uncharacterized protein n=1 Tax=Musca autumnalis TaxID=221902 RepID=UPI003CF7C225